jgi:hypothetical protein
MSDPKTPQTPFLILVAKRKLKGNSKIIINQINLGRWVCKFFTPFQAHSNGRM